MREIVEILIVEDEPTIRTVLELALLGEGYVHVSSVGRGDEALALARSRRPDLVLLDVMLPGLDGFAIARAIRADPALEATRILMLTARTENEDIVRGLESGADDYVTKPFDRAVLLARVAAVLRRGGTLAGVGGENDGLAIDEAAYRAVLDGEELALAPGEFRILAFLAANRGRVLARSRILDRIQSEEKAVTERTVDVQIANLRRKLGRWADHIETVRGVGYRVR